MKFIGGAGRDRCTPGSLDRLTRPPPSLELAPSTPWTQVLVGTEDTLGGGHHPP